MKRQTERRNLVLRRELLRRISVEYVEMPGLCLTVTQAQRLFALRGDICLRVLNELVDAQYLRRDASGAYMRDGTRP